MSLKTIPQLGSTTFKSPHIPQYTALSHYIQSGLQIMNVVELLQHCLEEEIFWIFF